MDSDASDYRFEVAGDLSSVDAEAWNALLDRQAQPTPFLRMEYLRALTACGCATPQTGWVPMVHLLHKAEALVGACVSYAKSHSYGEYVFDWAWADAYRRHGLRYYPKLLLAVPFTPVPGTRLMASSPTDRRRLVAALREHALAARWSSAHALFLDPDDRQAFADDGWMIREGVQFHWHQPSGGRWKDFTEFLGSLQRDKRKKILQERRRVLDADVRFSVHEGSAIDDDLWDFFHRCYSLTYAAHHSTPYLTRAFWSAMAREMPANWVMFVASRRGERIAASLLAIDRDRRAAWGRYWGSTCHLPCLHFEACYYQPLQWCIEQGIDRFEGGAQGEHKMARGLLPVRTSSAHWLRDKRFADAVRDFLEQESSGVGGYIGELEERNPFKDSVF